jgi:drug/metabolite transporter (DMT)-like permease
MQVNGRLPVGVGAALLAAGLFGASTPFAKLLVGRIAPVLLAALLYLGSGIGLAALYGLRSWLRHLPPSLTWRRAVRHHVSSAAEDSLATAQAEAPLGRADLPWLSGAVFFGGVVGPLLLMLGLRATPASAASLLLNLEGVFTALLAWYAFHENFDRRIAIGMAAIVTGGILLSWQGRPEAGLPWSALAIAGACACWGIDNNLTQKVSAGDPVQIAAIKGAVAGSVNLVLALLLGASLPSVGILLLAGAIGFLGYGLSLALFVLALRHIGTARTGAYFSLAPFVGAAISLLWLREPVGPLFLAAAALMGLGIWLHLSERHEHEHHHLALTHEHRHSHGKHHRHEHPPGVDPTEPHSHRHEHAPLTHRHPHFPDIHHRHGHQ